MWSSVSIIFEIKHNMYEHFSHCLTFDIGLLNGDKFLDWINTDILFVELLFVSYALSTKVFTWLQTEIIVS